MIIIKPIRANSGINIYNYTTLLFHGAALVKAHTLHSSVREPTANEAQLIVAAPCYIDGTRRLLRSLSLFPPDSDGVATAQAK